jgi:hypothetical protein
VNLPLVLNHSYYCALQSGVSFPLSSKLVLINTDVVNTETPLDSISFERHLDNPIPPPIHIFNHKIELCILIAYAIQWCFCINNARFKEGDLRKGQFSAIYQKTFANLLERNSTDIHPGPPEIAENCPFLRSPSLNRALLIQ